MRHGGDVYNNSIDIDYSVNLNPKECPEVIGEAIREGLTHIGEYPDLYQRELRACLAKLENVTENQVYGGNGASELLMATIMSVRPKKALLVAPGFYGYEHCLHASDCNEIVTYLLKEELDYALDDEFVDWITEDIDIIILADPMNPSGKNIPEDLLRMILNRAREVNASVVIDESFYCLSKKCLDKDNHVATFINNYSNIYIIRSFTKLFSVPGIRAGYIISNEDLISEVIRYLPEWNVSGIAEKVMETGTKVLQTEFCRESIELIEEQKNRLMQAFTKCGFKVYASDTLFFLVRGNTSLYKRLLEKGIMIRTCDDYNNLDNAVFRIAVKDAKSNSRLMEILSELEL